MTTASDVAFGPQRRCASRRMSPNGSPRRSLRFRQYARATIFSLRAARKYTVERGVPAVDVRHPFGSRAASSASRRSFPSAGSHAASTATSARVTQGLSQLTSPPPSMRSTSAARNEPDDESDTRDEKTAQQPVEESEPYVGVADVDQPPACGSASSKRSPEATSSSRAVAGAWQRARPTGQSGEPAAPPPRRGAPASGCGAASFPHRSGWHAALPERLHVARRDSTPAGSPSPWDDRAPGAPRPTACFGNGSRALVSTVLLA